MTLLWWIQRGWRTGGHNSPHFSNLDNIFLSSVGVEEIQIHNKRAIIGPPSKRHLNCFFRVAKNPYILVLFRGRGSGPLSSPSGSALDIFKYEGSNLACQNDDPDMHPSICTCIPVVFVSKSLVLKEATTKTI